MNKMHQLHHIEYMPTGELFAEQRDHWATPYRFNGKELDEETGYYYYGARYYTPELGIWLSVDPLSDKYPSMSAFMYCAGNPVVLVDPDGRELELADDWVRTERGTYLYDSRVKSQKDAVKRYGDKSQSIGTGYSFNSDYGKVILGDDGNFTVDGKSGKIDDQAKGFSKAWASVKGVVNKLDEGGSSHSSFDNKVREKAEPLAQGLALINPLVGVPNGALTAIKGEDIYGNEANVTGRVISGIGVAAGGVGKVATGMISIVAKGIDMTITAWTVYQTTKEGYKKQNNNENKKK
ncbi:MAG: RHS repeat-associated core domain-containing protein [Bacteroidales bacterium]